MSVVVFNSFFEFKASLPNSHEHFMEFVPGLDFSSPPVSKSSPRPPLDFQNFENLKILKIFTVTQKYSSTIQDINDFSRWAMVLMLEAGGSGRPALKLSLRKAFTRRKNQFRARGHDSPRWFGGLKRYQLQTNNGKVL